MNEIIVTGGTKSQREKVKSMAEFCIEKMMPKMKTLSIEIKLKHITGAMGYCLYLTKREFELEIGTNQRLRRLLETVAHEMVHVKQFARGELYQSSMTAKHRWQGKWQRNENHYYDLPWEIEAHGREIGLFVRWAEQHGHANKAWTQDD